jgi:hypothetical protein
MNLTSLPVEKMVIAP